MRKIFAVVLCAMLVVSVLGVMSAPVQKQKSDVIGAVPASAGLRFDISQNDSLNWAGYAVTGASGSVTAVSCSFTVPSLSTQQTVLSFPGQGKGPPAGHSGSSKTTYAAFWAGIDGYESSTVEQAGVLMEVTNGQVAYSVWYEYYPAYPVYAAWHPHAGDVMVVYVNYTSSNSKFTATVIDLTTHQTYSSQPTSVSGAERNSAEWIAEAPASANRILPLADFGEVDFGYSYTGVTQTNFATVSGTTASIGTLSSSLNGHLMDMVKRNGSLKAQTSELSTDGTSFTVTWISS